MERSCKHQWGLILVKYQKKILPTLARICLKCGTLKIGNETIKISRFRLDMDGKPIKNVSQIDISSRLKIPVGTDLYS
jgi:hypothetical protein